MFDAKQLIFMKNIEKSIVSKPLEHNKNANTILFILLFTTGQREKIIEKTFVVSTSAQDMCKKAGSGSTLPQYLPNPRRNFQ